ncbi:hypothetical protein SAMN05443247_00098 [Bradyrhizobium erythrophlei]|jgi:hypothetical protein|nr:hypothetical protein SAMN05443247_00098 [Bradyrhizobium erythrophlei]
MLTRQFPFLDPARIDPDLARRLRVLADDCDRLELGRPVSPILLQKAPLLEDWFPTVTPLGVQLVGRVTGHPLLGDCAAATTPLWFADPDGTWARSLSRFYRLGPPLDRDDIRSVLGRMANSSTTSDDGSEDEA